MLLGTDVRHFLLFNIIKYLQIEDGNYTTDAAADLVARTTGFISRHGQ